MNTAGSVSHEEVQAFLDDVSSLKLAKKQNDWYQIDVSAILDGCEIQGHEIDEASGDSLVFLKSSLLFCSPDLGVMRHYPRSLIHCFVEDKRSANPALDHRFLFKAELFSVTPDSEQLCWIRACKSHNEVPFIQSVVSGWMKWLNQS